MAPIKVTRSRNNHANNIVACENRLRSEGLNPYPIEQQDGDVIGEHVHASVEVRLCCKGKILFLFEGKKVTLGVGDRIDIPPFVKHSIRVLKGPALMLCATR